MIMHSRDTFSATRRLLVLMPDVNFNVAHLAQRVVEITCLETMAIVFIANAAEKKDEYRVRRRLATLAALMRDECARVETHFTLDQNWARVLNTLYQRGDVIVCHAEQTGQNGRPLRHELEDRLTAPVYVISGLYLRNKQSDFQFTSWAIKFLIPAIIFLGFLGIQIPLDSSTSGVTHLVLMSFTVIVEYALLAIWATLSHTF